MEMHPECSRPWEETSISDILTALELNDGAIAEEPNDVYFVVPGNEGPRWIVPIGARASASVLNAWRPYSFVGQAKWLAIRIAARAGMIQLFPSVSSLTISRRTAQRWFEKAGIAAQAGEMVILVGNPSPYRKLIVFMLDDADRIAAVLKIGLTTGGRLNVVREAEILGQFEPFCWAPNILSVHPDIGAASQEYVHGTMADRGFRSEYLDLLCHLPLSGDSANLANVAKTVAGRLSSYTDSLHRTTHDLLDRCLACLDLDTSVPIMLVHGDFAPWNIRNTSEFGYVLIDWESANFAGLPLHDLLHFHFSEDRRSGGKGGGYAAIRKKEVCAEYLKRMDLDVKLFSKLAILYLLEQLELEYKYQVSGEKASYLMRQMAIVIETEAP